MCSLTLPWLTPLGCWGQEWPRSYVFFNFGYELNGFCKCGKGKIYWHGVGENHHDFKNIGDPRCRVHIHPKWGSCVLWPHIRPTVTRYLFIYVLEAVHIARMATNSGGSWQLGRCTDCTVVLIYIPYIYLARMEHWIHRTTPLHTLHVFSLCFF